MRTVEDLKTLLDYHDDLYYNQDAPELSDEEYDNLKSQYLRKVLLEGSVPGEASSKFNKVKHLYGIKSLDKINTDSEVLKSLEHFDEGDITIKLDGLTIVVYGEGTLYDDKAVWATRGNGIDGEDVSHTCANITGLKAIDDVVYRCEVYMPKSEFERINKKRIKQGLEPFKNPRNAAAGMIRNLDAEKVEGLTYLAYRILGSDLKHTDQLEKLKSYGLNVVPYVKYDASNKDKAFDFVTTYDSKYRGKLPMEIDGLVIQSDLPDSINYYGETGHHPKDAVAYKFTSQGEWTVLRDIIWQVGRLGTISPVAVFDPVNILGSTITRATLHNISYIRALDLKLGSEIYVIKANDVIPRVAKVRNTNGVQVEIQELTKCPVCGESVTKVNDVLYCPSLQCPSKIVAQADHLAKKDALDIDGLSSKTIQKIFDAGLLNNVYQLFTLNEASLVRIGFTQQGAEKLYNTINKSILNVPFHRFLYATGVPLLGRRVSRDVAKAYSSVYELIDDLDDGNFSKLKTIPGIGDEICESMRANLGMIRLLNSEVSIRYEPKMYPGYRAYNFVITGALNHGTRDTYEALIASKGCNLQSSVTKKTDFLVTNEITMTSKRAKAEQLGIPIIDEYKFLEMIKN